MVVIRQIFITMAVVIYYDCWICDKIETDLTSKTHLLITRETSDAPRDIKVSSLPSPP